MTVTYCISNKLFYGSLLHDALVNRTLWALIFRYMYVERGKGCNPTKMSLTPLDYLCQVVQ